MGRQLDRIRVESKSGSIDIFNSIEVANDIEQPSMCGFDIGNDGSYETLAKTLKHGETFKVWLNDRLRMTGRVYSLEEPSTANEGTTVRVVIQSFMAEAHYASADPATRVEKVSIQDFLVALYAPLGITPSDFVFDADLSRNLITGKGAKGAAAPADLEEMKPDQAKVSPPESIFDAASKHLQRFGLMHWDTPDNKIYVGKPDENQQPLYRLQCKRGKQSAGNNVLSIQRVTDWSDVPSELRVYGGGQAKDATKAPFRGYESWLDVLETKFHRPVIILSSGAKNKSQVDAQARREMAKRSKRKDAFEIEVDGWSWFDPKSKQAIPWAINTTVDLDVDSLGGAVGCYYIHKVSCKGDAANQSTALSVVGFGTLDI